MLARLFICVLLITGSGSACIMVPSSPTHLRGNAVFGRFTYEGKPLKNASIQLRTAKGRDLPPIFSPRIMRLSPRFVRPATLTA